MPLLALATALGLGLLIGAVTERGHPEPPMIAGLRTHALAALCGAIALWLHLAAFVAVLVLLGVFVALSYRQSQHEDPGLTSEIALVLTSLLGGLAVSLPELAAGLGVVVAVLLYAKAPLHRITRELLSETELQDGLILLASALVILPLVPDRTLDPWGVFNPSLLWTLVVLVMAISTLGHIALRLVGNHWGLAVAGFFAGYVSSTAAVAGFGQRVRETPALLPQAVGAALLANLASLSLFVPVLLTVAPDLVSQLWTELAAASGVLLAGGALGLRRGSGNEPPPTAGRRMFRVSHAVVFAAIVTAVVIAAAALNAWLGHKAAFAGAAIAALAEVHAAVATVGQLHSGAVFDTEQARWALVALLGASALSKTVVAVASGGRAYGLRVGLGLALMVAAAFTAVVLT